MYNLYMLHTYIPHKTPGIPEAECQKNRIFLIGFLGVQSIYFSCFELKLGYLKTMIPQQYRALEMHPLYLHEAQHFPQCGVISALIATNIQENTQNNYL